MFGFLKKVKEFFVGVPELPKAYEEKKDYTAITYPVDPSVANNVLVSTPEGAAWTPVKTETVVVEEAVAAVEETPKKKRTKKAPAKKTGRTKKVK